MVMTKFFNGNLTLLIDRERYARSRARIYIIGTDMRESRYFAQILLSIQFERHGHFMAIWANFSCMNSHNNTGKMLTIFDLLVDILYIKFASRELADWNAEEEKSGNKNERITVEIYCLNNQSSYLCTYYKNPTVIRYIKIALLKNW